MIKVTLKNQLELIIDDEDAWVLDQYSVVADRRGGTWYVRAQRKGEGASKQPKLYLHRILCGARADQEVDHADGNGLNNTRANLRCATRSQNCLNRSKLPSNTSGFKGVYFSKARSRWFAKIVVGGIERKRGYFPTAEEAAAAYDQLAKKWTDGFGRLNENSQQPGCHFVVIPMPKQPHFTPK